MIRAAVIGVGAIGKHHARIYSELEGVELAALAEPDEARRQAAARRFRVPTYATHTDLLAAERIHVVSVTVPTGLHHPVALAALRAGAHVLVEKPITSTLAEADELIAEAAARRLTLTVGHIERFNPAVAELQKRLAAGDLGRVFQVQARRLSPFPLHVLDVGVVMDLATHELDMLRYLLGSEVVRLYAETSRNFHARHEDMLSSILRFANGVIGVLDINWLTPTKVRELRLTGERGMFQVDYITQDLYFYENAEAASHWDTLALFRGVEEGRVVKLRVIKAEPLQQELQAFVAAVRAGAPPAVTGADGRQALRLAGLLLESAQQKQVLPGLEVSAES
ncbi:MAG: Gfo/Idh/MocA family oxidoreductase [Anaerolineales bacterium]|nr:Gfo/Idh/MocA family oxidoreductase [Anaerolineales bacterium]